MNKTILLTPKQASEILQRPVTWIYHLLKTRRLKGMRDGRRYRIRENDLMDYIEAQLWSAREDSRNTFTGFGIQK